MSSWILKLPVLLSLLAVGIGTVSPAGLSENSQVVVLGEDKAFTTCNIFNTHEQGSAVVIETSSEGNRAYAYVYGEGYDSATATASIGTSFDVQAGDSATALLAEVSITVSYHVGVVRGLPPDEYGGGNAVVHVLIDSEEIEVVATAPGHGEHSGTVTISRAITLEAGHNYHVFAWAYANLGLCGIGTFESTSEAIVEHIDVVFASPNFSYRSYAIDDSLNDLFLFDRDNEVDPGETIVLSVELQNDGLGEAHTVTATLSTVDPDIDTLTDSVEVAANVLPGETCTAAGFLFDVDSSFNGRPIEFTLNVTSNEGSWDYSFVVVPEWRRDLARGDVVFFRELPIFPMYSHVGIYLGEGWVIDSHGLATPRGVQVRPIAFYDNRKAGAAYRVSCASSQQIEQAIAFAVAQIGLPYHWVMIDKHKEGFHLYPHCCPDCFANHCFYCSELVWAAFLHATPEIDLASSRIYSDPVSPDELIGTSSCTELMGAYNKEALAGSGGVWMKANCPVDLIVVDPQGRAAGRNVLEIDGTLYIDADLNGDGHRITALNIPAESLSDGWYTVEVVAKDTASSTDTYDLDVFQPSGQTTLAVDVAICEIPSQPYSVWVESGTPAVFRVVSSGNVHADQTFHAAAFQAGAADIAEWVGIAEPVVAGDVIELDPTNPVAYRPSRYACSLLVAGVVSTAPAVTLGAGGREAQALLALVGIVPVKVTNEGGPIQPGDLLVTSSTPGHAMRWAGSDPCPCALVGKALEPMTDETGVILVLLTAH